MRFATRGADKFTGAGFVADENGIPVLPLASAVLRCNVHACYAGGDHSILVGEVHDVRLGVDTPAIYFQRSFHSLGL